MKSRYDVLDHNNVTTDWWEIMKGKVECGKKKGIKLGTFNTSFPLLTLHA